MRNERFAEHVACTLNALDFQSINFLEQQFHAATLVEALICKLKQ